MQPVAEFSGEVLKVATSRWLTRRVVAGVPF
jgi:hypothetical protein